VTFEAILRQDDRINPCQKVDYTPFGECLANFGLEKGRAGAVKRRKARQSILRTSRLFSEFRFV
jgi:hypothetical protein